jgi:glycyl-tRNA synthetase alpha subunit
MAAGGLSYSGLVNHGKVNLPSVESWGTNMNILKDPPKSITTRRKIKVGETSSITQMIEESDGRSSEAIQVYARGVNPFVSVSYDNVGNNGGRTYGGIVEGGGRSAKLPHRIMQDGAFRPPVLLQQDLLPLSRLPRTITNAFSNAGFTDFSRKLRTCGTDENTKEVKKNTLKTSVRPTAVYRIEKQAEKPFEVKYVIQPSIKNAVSSGVRPMDITQRHWGTPTKEINNDLLHPTAHSAVSKVQHVNNNKFNTKRFTQDSLAHPAYSNISSIGYVDNNELESGRFLQDTLVHPAYSNVSSIGNVNNNELESTRFLQDTLVHPAYSNVSSIGHVDNNELESRRFLQDTLVHPAYSNVSSIGHVDNNELESRRFLQDTLVHPAYSNVSSIGNVNNNELESRRFLQDTLVHPAYSNVSSIGHIDNNELESTRFLQDTLVHPAYSNVSSIGNYSGDNQMETGRFVQEPLVYSAGTNVSSNAHNTSSIENIFDSSNMPIHNDVNHYNVDSKVSGVQQTKYFHDDIALSRTLPNFNATTNVGDQNVYKRTNYDNEIELQRNNPSASCESNPTSRGNTNYLSTQVQLAPKISAGGYSIPAQIPMKERDHIYYDQESEKAKMNRMVMESMNGRFDRVNPFTDLYSQ